MKDWNLDYELVQTLSPVSSFYQDILSQQQEMKSWQLLRQTSLRYEAQANWSFICGCMISGAMPSFHKKAAEEKKATRPRTHCSQRAHVCSVQALRWTTKPKFLASKVGIYWSLFLSALPCMVELALNSHNGQMTRWVSICLPHSNREKVN